MRPPDRKLEVGLVGAILLGACATRLIGLAQLPEGILPDEASNGYDAYSILRTGKDRWGEPWPIVLEAFGRGDYRPALYAYLVVPAVALLGPENLVAATRLPAALGGVVTIGCLYWLARRTCGRQVAVWAALLLTLSPWHVYQSRFGHESSLAPLFPVLGLLTLSLAGWPLSGRAQDGTAIVRLRWSGMAAFGLVIGLAPYTYASLKLFLPAMLVAGALMYRSVWPQVLRRRESRFALLVGALVLAVVVAPMVWLTFTDWDTVNARAEHVSLFHQGQPLFTVLKECVGNWVAHFGATWLFVEGSSSVFSTIPGVGQVNWYMLALLPLGLLAMWLGRRGNRVYAVLFAWLLLHPVTSALTRESPHMLRAACGLGSFQWVGAVGIGAVSSWVGRRSQARWMIPALLLVAVAGNARWSLGRYYRVFGSHVRLSQLFQADLRDAILLIRDRWREYDRIFVSDHPSAERYWMSDHPYIHVLLFLPVDPAEFHAWEKRVLYAHPGAPFHRVESMGPFTLSTQPRVLDEYFRQHPDQPVLFLARPGDIQGGRPLHTIRDVRGRLRFEIIEVIPPTGKDPTS